MLSHAFTLAGAHIYITSRSASACNTVATNLTNLASSAQSGGTCTSLPADLASVEECNRLVSELRKRETKLHGVIHNSGATWGAPYDSYPDSAWEKVLTLNLHRVFTLTQLLTPLLEAAAGESRDPTTGLVSDPARVICIGSIDGLSGRVPMLPTFAYSASKAGLHQLARHLAVELGPRGITSNVVACGPFPSKMMAATLEEFGEGIRAANPLGRIGTTEDVAGACMFLASRAGAYVNGATVTVDGGVSLVSKL